MYDIMNDVINSHSGNNWENNAFHFKDIIV